ncbi:MAG: hypothetical protein A2W93_14980 [Bacteroidetes bacterium GWF2_43_63]|nr:MAG: hypothetical protein A2W94_01550 [Bacteroidetes bacterium GWE2_42_42]OFY52640.1 MAG: hypothetical protein A2W93_14980 [Bacteroidetes bacterium GWF2_43_63]HBG69914.1 hypothetical protein [Bacteroidales bacterium]HCB62660.1 hypothetical protein [Bacteroidales bacterium]HCY23780.1 hypothetical protein [Bacteroidales bacterium]
MRNSIIYGLVITSFVALTNQSAHNDRPKNNLPNKSIIEAAENSPGSFSSNDQPELLLPLVTSGKYSTSGNVILSVGAAQEDEFDDPTDNQLDIFLNGIIPENKSIYLEYDLFGVADFTSVCRSINDNIANGGLIVRLKNEWSHQREKISFNQLQSGKNIIRFSSPEGSGASYKIKNVSIVISNDALSNNSLEVNIPQSCSYFGNSAYLSGMVNKTDDLVSIEANGTKLRYFNSAFEGFVPLNNEPGSIRNIDVVATFSNGEKTHKQVVLSQNSSYDFKSSEINQVSFKQVVALPENSININLDGFSLSGAAGSVKNQLTLSVTGLRTEDMPMLDADMVNVTALGAGYRCLPHGEHFANGVQLSIKYDSTLIPAGYGPEDIRTFYYDETKMDWSILPIDSVDVENNCILSTTTHFTDFINSILKTPEAPQTEAFTPTSMKDMAYADPLAGITIMGPPSANNTGTANLSYPIQIPAGRQGMQPQLSLSYNNEGGNGILGVGWNLASPAITVETRWGVPTYSDQYESEEYLVNGEQIVELVIAEEDTTRLQLVHQGTYRARGIEQETFFSYRIEGAFDRLIRHGNDPSNYWWEVVDKQGTRYYYGKYYSDATVNPSCVLQDGAGNIAHWALTEIRDMYGNYVKYEYIHESSFSRTPGTGGKEIYLSRIEYTGYDGAVTEQPKYSIDFTYTNNRNDYIISGRYGLLEVTDFLLREIDIKYDNLFVRSYVLGYKSGAYSKNLLCAIAEVSDEQSLTTVNSFKSCGEFVKDKTPGVKVHSFDYYEEVGVSFENTDQVLLSLYEIPEELHGSLVQFDEKQSLGKSKSISGGLGGTVSFGIGNPANKLNSIGGDASTSLSALFEKVMFVDLNGDGLKDKIVRENSELKFYRGELDPFNRLFYSATLTPPVIDLPDLGTNWSNSNTLGAEINVGCLGVSGSASMAWTKERNMTNKYFVDVNADGYVDYISEGDVYYNYPDASGIPEFTMETSATEQVVGDDPCYTIIRDGSIDPEFSETGDDAGLYRRDPVRMWIAPDLTDKQLRISSDIQRVNPQNLQNHKISYTIQHNGTIIHYGDIAADDFTAHNYSVCLNNVVEGDRIYFRILSDDIIGMDDVNWNTKIYSYKCQETPFVDADEKPLHDFIYSNDAVIHDGTYFTAPLSGVIKVTGVLNSPAQSDDLQFVIKHNQTAIHNVSFSNNTPIQNHTFSYSIPVTEGDSIPIKLLANTNVNWSDIDFSAVIEYVSAVNFQIIPNDPIFSIKYYPSLNMSIFPKRNCRAWPKVLSAGHYKVFPKLEYGLTPAGHTGTVVFTAKSTRKLLAKTVLIVVDGFIQGSPYIEFTLDPGATVFFEYFTSDPDLNEDVSMAKVYDNNLINDFKVGYHSLFDEDRKLFGNMYQGWGQFSYYDNAPASSYSVIDENELTYGSSNMSESYLSSFQFSTITSASSFQDVQNIFNGFGISDPSSLYFVPMSANREKDRWEDFTKSTYTEYYNSGSGGVITDLLGILTNLGLSGENSGSIPDFNNPVPESNSAGYVRAIHKFSKQKTESFSVSVSAGITESETTSNSYPEGYTDFTDLNGDKYPDIVSEKLIQYSTSYGGISNSKLDVQPEILISSGYAHSEGSSIGIGGIIHEGSKSQDPAKSKSSNISGSISYGITNSNSEVTFIYADINGDGLSDRIDRHTNMVAFNLGYRFSPFQAWDHQSISNSISDAQSISLGLSFFNKYNDSWAGGLCGSAANNYNTQSMMDVNNDGLPDVCINNGSSISAYINTGNSFVGTQTMNSSFTDKISYSKAYNVAGNIAYTIGFPIGFFKLAFSGYINGSYNISYEKYKIEDINGDGFLDFVYVGSDDQIHVNYGIPKKTNVLKTVHTPVQSSYTVDYALDYTDRKNPSSRWNMASLVVYDGVYGDGENKICYKFEYENAFYHRMERDFFGYETVWTKQFNNLSTSGVCYRITEEQYHNDFYLFKGLKKYDQISDGSQNMYVETVYKWDAKQISDGVVVNLSTADCFGPYYPAISDANKYYYEGTGMWQVRTRKSWVHGSHGNVKEYINYGDVADQTDDIHAYISYVNNQVLYNSDNLCAMVENLQVKDYQTILLQKRSAEYYTTGKVWKINAFEGSNMATTEINYDSYGNILDIFLPEDVNHQRLSYSSEYDNFVHTYTERTIDSWGNISSATYDLRHGLPLEVTDITGNKMKYTYDPGGRMKTVTGPNEILNGIAYTISCEYWDENSAGGNGFWAKTRHYDPMNTSTNNEFITVNFADGLGRSIQSKKKITENGVDVILVSGIGMLDSYGRVISISQPVTELSGSETTLNLSIQQINPTTTTYDVMDRPLVQNFPDGTQMSYLYDFGTDAFGTTCFKTKATDPKNKVTEKFTNGRGLNTSVTAPLSTITKFVYDPLGELIRSTDPENNMTTYEYDMLGRLLNREHPDAGKTKYTYDMAGNVLTTTTQNLANLNQEIKYYYSNLRLQRIEYPQNPEMNVYYEYGAPNSGNQSGRMTEMQDASGVQSFEYGNMGELIKNTHTFVVPAGAAYTFETDWEYDSWNRVKNITYPDGEVVSYHYNNGGQLTSMDGQKGPHMYSYITGVRYNKYGSRTYIGYGNGTYANYSYNPQNLRLTNLQSFQSNGVMMQNINYTYDNSGNITLLNNTAGYAYGNTGGGYRYEYEYDDLYRLTGARGMFSGFGNQQDYELSMSYSQSGNITTKNLYAETSLRGSINYVSYNNTYSYSTTQPHAVETAGTAQFKWDANGNMTERHNSGNVRNQCWDEENRLTTVHDKISIPMLSSYVYNAGGERVWKLSNSESTLMLRGRPVFTHMILNKTLYISPMMVMTDKEYTKHYFIEGERVCTKVGGGFHYAPTDPDGPTLHFINGNAATAAADAGNMVFRGVNCSGYPVSNVEIGPGLRPATNNLSRVERQQYFYHPDHIGSSSFITNATGYATEHLQYLPYGELFVDQTPPHNDFETRYKFSGKELDPETNYSYFGARYYDSDLSVWLSVDPMASQFPSHSPYNYCFNNPVRLVDPDGLAPDDPPWVYGQLYSNSLQAGHITSHDIKKNTIGAAAILLTPVMIFGGEAALPYLAQGALWFSGNPAAQFATVETGAFFANVLNPGPDDIAPTPGPGGEIGNFVESIIKNPYTSKQLGNMGECALRMVYGGGKKSFNTALGWRFVDNFANGVAYESKVGYTSATQFVQQQFNKDIELLKSGAVDEVVWTFYRSPVTNSVGASQPLLKMFENAQKNGYNIRTQILNLPTEAIEQGAR